MAPKGSSAAGVPLKMNPWGETPTLELSERHLPLGIVGDCALP